VVLATKQAITALFDVIQYELPQLVDDGDGVLVAFTLSIAPGEETVAAQNDPIAVGLSRTARRSIMPSSNPGRCQGSQIKW